MTRATPREPATATTTTAAETPRLVSLNHKIETDKILGPLPENWDKVPVRVAGGLRHFYVDHNTKSTTWIDPRTLNIRKHNILDVEKGELPYGWEETVDDNEESYFIDHTTQRNYRMPPWSEETRCIITDGESKEIKSVVKVAEPEEIKKYKELQKEEEKQEEVEVEEEEEVEEDDLEETAPLGGPEPSEPSEPEKPASALDETIAELRNLNAKLQQENNLLISDSKTRNMQLSEIRQMIEAEKAQRQALESYILQLRQEIVQISHQVSNSAPQSEADEQEQEQEATEKDNEEEAAVEKAYDAVEVDLEQLQFRLQVEQEERVHLRELTKTLLKERDDANRAVHEASVRNSKASTRVSATAPTMETEELEPPRESVAKAYTAPDWVKQLDLRGRARILRAKMMNVLGDEAAFQDKLKFFSEAAKRDGLKPKVPEPVTKAENAVRARETAFGRVILDTSETNPDATAND